MNWSYGYDTKNMIARDSSKIPSKNGKCFSDYRQLLDSGQIPYLVPPTWKKVFDNAPKQVWSEAVGALKEATRIIMIGFSMPPTDIHFHYLLAAGLQENISLRNLSVVNFAATPEDTERLQENFEKIFQLNFSQKIIWHWHGVQQFFARTEALRSIGREIDTSRFSSISPRGSFDK